MADAPAFSFDGLFAKSAPEPRPAVAGRRGKYDFAVAYPAPASLPLHDLVESLQAGLQ